MGKEGGGLLQWIRGTVSSRFSAPPPSPTNLAEVAKAKAADAASAGLSAAKDLGSQAIKSASNAAAESISSIPTPGKAVAAAGRMARTTQRNVAGFIVLLVFAYGAGTALPHAIADYMKAPPAAAALPEASGGRKGAKVDSEGEERPAGAGWALPWGRRGGASKAEEDRGHISHGLGLVGLEGKGGKDDGAGKGYLSQAVELVGLGGKGDKGDGGKSYLSQALELVGIYEKKSK